MTTTTMRIQRLFPCAFCLVLAICFVDAAAAFAFPTAESKSRNSNKKWNIHHREDNPSLRFRLHAKKAAARGFGSSSSSSASAAKTKHARKKKKPMPIASFQFPPDPGTASLADYLHPRLLETERVSAIPERLRNGQVVIIPNAFRSELAEAVHEQLDALAEPGDGNDSDGWSHHEDYFPDGYHYRHSNIYQTDDCPGLLQDLHAMLGSQATQEFMQSWSGRDCSGSPISGAPSYYQSGDHSLPHTDHIGQRSVAYIWHLSKNWRPEWGGALYWCNEPLANAYHAASFNTLVLFSVTPHSSHFVTTVSPHATQKRLAYNGWWHASWVPTAADGAALVKRLATPRDWTHAQVLALDDILDDPWAPQIQPPELRPKVQALRDAMKRELYPESQSGPIE